MYSTLRREFYWPSMAADCYAFVRSWATCARDRIKLRRNTKELKLFPATGPLEEVSIDLLGPFQKTPRRNTHLWS